MIVVGRSASGVLQIILLGVFGVGRIERDGGIVGIDDVILGAALIDAVAAPRIGGSMVGEGLIAGVDDRLSGIAGTDKIPAVDLRVGVVAVGLAVFVLLAKETAVLGLAASVTFVEATKAMGAELVVESSGVEELLTD